MSKKTTAKKTEKNATAKTETKAAKPPREKAPKEDLMTFALRMTKAESVALHKAAGPGRASRVMRALAGAFAAGDEAAFRAVVKEARETRQ